MKFRYNLILFLPISVFTLGIILNAIATNANGGFMPVQVPGGCPDSMGDWNHICMTAQTHLHILSDIITANDGVSSIGDFLQDLGRDIRYPSLLAWIGVQLHGLIHTFRNRV